MASIHRISGGVPVAKTNRAATSGRSFSADEIDGGAKVAIVGQVVVDKLFDDTPPVGESFRIGSVPFTVIGVLEAAAKK